MSSSLQRELEERYNSLHIFRYSARLLQLYNIWNHEPAQSCPSLKDHSLAFLPIQGIALQSLSYESHNLRVVFLYFLLQEIKVCKSELYSYMSNYYLGFKI